MLATTRHKGCRVRRITFNRPQSGPAIAEHGVFVARCSCVDIVGETSGH